MFVNDEVRAGCPKLGHKYKEQSMQTDAYHSGGQRRVAPLPRVSIPPKKNPLYFGVQWNDFEGQIRKFTNKFYISCFFFWGGG